MKGVLYIVATPLGNLEDITLRALKVLKEVDVIAAEDTRHSLKLLNHFGIAKPLLSYCGEKEKARSEAVLERLREGRSVALISDAGTPGIADPGTLLIRKAVEAGIPVVPVPGPSAFVSALSLSGFSTDSFIFAGFLPAKKSQREKTLRDLSLERRTIVFYEAPHRIVQTLGDLAAVFGERQAMVVKEMTKMHEEVYRGSPSGLREQVEVSVIAGEYVVVVEGRTGEAPLDGEVALAEVRSLMKKGLGRKEAVRRVAEQYGFSKKELYDRSLEGD